MRYLYLFYSLILTTLILSSISHAESHMPERVKYAHLFERNPFEAKNPREVFSLLHWGNQAANEYEIDAPEPLIMLGMAAMLESPDYVQFRFDKGEAFIAVGRDSNELYIIPRKGQGPIPHVPPFSKRAMNYQTTIRQTDYLSTKGGSKEHYYYHKHERPYPELWLHEATGVGYLRAANHKGKPSYAVGKEGIVG